jgi:phosphate transport system substrate-binding protein
MKALKFYIVLTVILIPTILFAADEIRIGGSGGMIPLVTDLANAYMDEHPDVNIDVMQRSIESSGGIRGAAAGKLDLGTSARPLKEKEKGRGLEVLEIARVATVVGVNAKTVNVDNISSNKLCSVYKGKVTGWSELGGANAKIMAFTRPDGDSSKKVVRKGIPCFKSLTESKNIVVMPKSKDMYNALINNRHSIGFTDMVAVGKSRGKIGVLNLDGISPSGKSVASGKWPLIKRFHIMSKGQPTGLAKKFIDFIKSDKGAKIIKKNNAVPVN